MTHEEHKLFSCVLVRILERRTPEPMHRERILHKAQSPRPEGRGDCSITISRSYDRAVFTVLLFFGPERFPRPDDRCGERCVPASVGGLRRALVTPGASHRVCRGL